MNIIPVTLPSPATATTFDRLAAAAAQSSARYDDFMSTFNALEPRDWRVGYELKWDLKVRNWAVGEQFKIEHHLAKTILSMS